LGAFTTGGAWLATHLWEHYLYTGDQAFLRANYPILKGCVEFFLDFLIPHPKRRMAGDESFDVAREFSGRSASVPFFDEITMFMTGSSMVAGSTIDMQILNDLFAAYARAAGVLGLDPELGKKALEAKARLAPLQIGRKGNIQEWLDDWDETEKNHRHLSPLWGSSPASRSLFGRRRNSPRPARSFWSSAGVRQRLVVGLEGGRLARLGNGAKFMDNFTYAMHNYTTNTLFSICSRAMQVDGAFGFAAAIAETLLQSHEDELNLLPALPESWASGEVSGLVARGGFEVGLKWKDGRLDQAALTSRLGNICRVRAAVPLKITANGKPVAVSRPENGVIEFKTAAGAAYLLTAAK